MKKYTIVEPASFRLDGGAMFGIIPKPMWSKVHPADAQNRIDLALRLLLIQNNGKNILIDTGIGDYHGDKFDERFHVTKGDSPLKKALAEINLKLEDITDLVISHLHFDHAGGIGEMVDGKITPVLKNATLHLHKEHYKYAQTPYEKDAGSFHNNIFNPVIDWYAENKKIHWLEGENGVVVDDIKFLTSQGHTPFLIHPYDDKFIYLADLIPTSNHVHIPWVMAYDLSPGITTADKRRVLKFTSDHNLTIIFEHDPKFFGSKVRLDDKGNYLTEGTRAGEYLKAYTVTF